MIDGAKVCFVNGNEVDVERVKFKSGGWIGVRTGETWIYYPPHAIGRILSIDDDTDVQDAEETDE